MDYIAATSLDQALRALEHDDARCLAGGQSLIAMINLGLVAPERLVSLRSIKSLQGITEIADGAVRIGAMTTHAELASYHFRNAGQALIARTASQVAYPAIRQWGTIGGSIAHADPSADYPVALLACQATIEISSPLGVRRISAAQFFTGFFETALVPGDIVTAIEIPSDAQQSGSAYRKLSLVNGDFAILSVAAVTTPGTIRVAVGGYGPMALCLPMLESGDDATLKSAVLRFAAGATPPADHRASARYRVRVLPELIYRAVRGAQAEHKA